LLVRSFVGLSSWWKKNDNGEEKSDDEGKKEQKKEKGKRSALFAMAGLEKQTRQFFVDGTPICKSRMKR
jgi:hypothetical protein